MSSPNYDAAVARHTNAERFIALANEAFTRMQQQEQEEERQLQLQIDALCQQLGCFDASPKPQATGYAVSITPRSTSPASPKNAESLLAEQMGFLKVLQVAQRRLQ